MKQEKRDRGVALFTAIWVAALLAVIALGVTRDARTAALIAGNERRSAQARAAADAGVERLAVTLLAEAVGARLPPSSEEEAMPSRYLHRTASIDALEDLPVLGSHEALAVDGRRYRLAFGEAMLVLRAQAEIGKVDLNHAQEEVLRRLIVDLAPEEGPVVVERILARRNRPAGAQVSPWRLHAEHFYRISDLARLGFAAPPVYARLAPYLTVTGRTALPDPLTAPQAALSALGLSSGEMAEVSRIRAAPPAPRDWRDGLILTLSAQAVMPDGTWAEARALTRVSSSEAGSLTHLERDGDVSPMVWAPSR